MCVEETNMTIAFHSVKRFDVKYATSGGSFVNYGFTVA